jgi:hypothetical protein
VCPSALATLKASTIIEAAAWIETRHALAGRDSAQPVSMMVYAIPRFSSLSGAAQAVQALIVHSVGAIFLGARF